MEIESFHHFMMTSDKVSEEDREEYKRSKGYYDTPKTNNYANYCLPSRYEIKQTPVVVKKMKSSDFDEGVLVAVFFFPILIIYAPLYLFLRLIMYVVDDLTGNHQ